MWVNISVKRKLKKIFKVSIIHNLITLHIKQKISFLTIFISLRKI